MITLTLSCTVSEIQYSGLLAASRILFVIHEYLTATFGVPLLQFCDVDQFRENYDEWNTGW